jgi:hypothetical protein
VDIADKPVDAECNAVTAMMVSGIGDQGFGIRDSGFGIAV